MIGNPLIIDVATKQYVFGHYARVLVDLDFSRRVFDEIIVEEMDFLSNWQLIMNGSPDYCTHCRMIGHDVMVCHWLIPTKAVEKVDKVDRWKKPTHAHKQLTH